MWYSQDYSFPSPFTFHVYKFLASAGMGRVHCGCRSWGPVLWEGSALEKELPLPKQPPPGAVDSHGAMLYWDWCMWCCFPLFFFPLWDNYKLDILLLNTERQATKPSFPFFWYDFRGSVGWWTSFVSLSYSLAYVGRKKDFFFFFFLLPWKMLFFLGPEAPLLSLASNNPSVHPYVKATLQS